MGAPSRAANRRSNSLQARPQRQLARAQHLDDRVAPPPRPGPVWRAGSARRSRRLAAGRDGARALPVPRGLRPGCMPYSSESTSASQEAAIRFSETPIEPHTSCPSEASISTRVTAPVPWLSSRIRTLKLTSSMSRRCGCSSPIASRSAASSAFTGPLPSAVRTKRSPPSQTLIVASVATFPSARFSTSTRQDSRRNSGSYSPASLRISSSSEPSAASNWKPSCSSSLTRPSTRCAELLSPPPIPASAAFSAIVALPESSETSTSRELPDLRRVDVLEGAARPPGSRRRAGRPCGRRRACRRRAVPGPARG